MMAALPLPSRARISFLSAASCPTATIGPSARMATNEPSSIDSGRSRSERVETPAAKRAVKDDERG